jgi:hypothetical protein
MPRRVTFDVATPQVHGASATPANGDRSARLIEQQSDEFQHKPRAKSKLKLRRGAANSSAGAVNAVRAPVSSRTAVTRSREVHPSDEGVTKRQRTEENTDIIVDDAVDMDSSRTSNNSNNNNNNTIDNNNNNNSSSSSSKARSRQEAMRQARVPRAIALRKYLSIEYEDLAQQDRSSSSADDMQVEEPVSRVVVDTQATGFFAISGSQSVAAGPPSGAGVQ